MPEPDVLLVTAEHLGRVGERYVEGPPDVVVEVSSSSSTRRLDLVPKRQLYERFGVAEYWFVDLDADRVEVYVLGDGRYGVPTIIEREGVLVSSVLNGLEVAVEEMLVD